MTKKTKVQISSLTAKERAELYFAAHPGSPSAARRPSLSQRSGAWVALMGKDLRNGVVGLGMTVEAALRAFDAQYLTALRLPMNRKHPLAYRWPE